MGAPVQLLPPCRMASSRKENNPCKNKRLEAGCGVKGARTPSRQRPARSARGAILPARRRHADREQPARKRRYLPPAPARQPVLPVGSPDQGWLRDPEFGGTALPCSPFPWTPTSPASAARGGTRRSRAAERHGSVTAGHAACSPARSSLSRSPQWRDNYIFRHGATVPPASWPRVPAIPSRAPWPEEVVGWCPSCTLAICAQLQLLAQVVLVTQQLGWFPPPPGCAENRQPCRGTLLPGMVIPLFQNGGTSPTESCAARTACTTAPACSRPLPGLRRGAAAGKRTGMLPGTSFQQQLLAHFRAQLLSGCGQ